MKRIILISIIALMGFSIYAQQETTTQLLDQGINQITRKNYRKAIELFDKAIAMDNGDQSCMLTEVKQNII